MIRTTMNRAAAAVSAAFGALFALVPASVGEIVFVDMADLQLAEEGAFTVADGPFQATIHLGIPCEELPPGIWGPPCIAIYGDGIGDSNNDGSVDRLAADTLIDSQYGWANFPLLAGFELVDPENLVWRPISNDWFDRSAAPVRGFVAVRSAAAGGRYEGWIELTAHYEPADPAFSVVLHGFAYEDEPGVPILAGDTGAGCPADLDGDNLVGLNDLTVLLSNFGSSGAAIVGDIDGNGSVGLEDLTALLGMFGAEC